MYSSQNTYAKFLSSYRGVPLFIPEPNSHLPDSYQREGLKIGDVGVITGQGQFDVFFNICLSRDHSLHSRGHGVPSTFTQIEGLVDSDYAIHPNLENAGSVISTVGWTSTSFTDRHTDPARLVTEYQFSLTSGEGALLILPQGAFSRQLLNTRRFKQMARKHALNWYDFAVEELGRDISPESLYLITGFYKCRSWSLAAFSTHAVSAPAQCTIVRQEQGDLFVPDASTWRNNNPMDSRIGPAQYEGHPNQTVFISGFKIAIRRDLLGKKVVKVIAHDAWARNTIISWFISLGSGFHRGGTTNTKGSEGGNSTAGYTRALARDSRNPPGELDTTGQVTLEQIPQVLQPFHPSDIINQYILQQDPSALIAVTHDSDWMTLLERRILRPEDLMEATLLNAVIAQNYDIHVHQGAASLVSRHPPTFYLSKLKIALSTNSRHNLSFVDISTNDYSKQVLCRPSGRVLEESFTPSLVFPPGDHLCISIHFRSMWKKPVRVTIHPQDICAEFGRSGGMEVYHRVKRGVEVAINVQSLRRNDSDQLRTLANEIIKSFSRYHILVVGKLGVGKSSLIRTVTEVLGVRVLETLPGMDAHGMGEVDLTNRPKLEEIINQYQKMHEFRDRLHLIWLCLPIPLTGGRLIDGDLEEFLDLKKRTLGGVPIVVVFTKLELLTDHLTTNETMDDATTPEQLRLEYLDWRCIKPLRQVMERHSGDASRIPMLAVSTESRFSDTVAELLKVTTQEVAKYVYAEVPRMVPAIAQWASIKVKISSTISLAKQRYWKLIAQGIFSYTSASERLKAIHGEVVKVWNLSDPEMHLQSGEFMETLRELANQDVGLRQNTASQPTRTATSLSMTLVPVLAAKRVYNTSQRVVKLFMTYIADLASVMQISFILAQTKPVTTELVHFALETYRHGSLIQVHREIEDFSVKAALLPAGARKVLQKIEKLLLEYSLGDDEIVQIRQGFSSFMGATAHMDPDLPVYPHTERRVDLSLSIQDPTPHDHPAPLPDDFEEKVEEVLRWTDPSSQHASGSEGPSSKRQTVVIVTSDTTTPAPPSADLNPSGSPPARKLDNEVTVEHGAGKRSAVLSTVVEESTLM